jgi:hypothetical protein
MAFFLPPNCSFWLLGILGTKVDDARDDSCRGRFMVWLYMAAMSSHVGGLPICTDRCSIDDLMKSHGSIRVVRIWCGIHTDRILRCFVNLLGLKYGDLLVGVVLELASWLTV